jgi:D-aminopeptidase
MQLFLGDRITIVKDGTYITGKTRGIVLDAHGQIERIFLDALDTSFYLTSGWKIVDEDDESLEEEEEE